MLYNKNGGVCKNLDLNFFKIDQVIAILSSKKVFKTFFELSNNFHLMLGNIAITLPILMMITD